MPTDIPHSQTTITRVIDFKIPLPYLISASAALVIFLFSLHADVRQLVRDVNKMQLTTETGNLQLASITSEQALQRFRLDAMEQEVQALRERGESKKSGRAP